ncbi:hypothetical protein [Treponema sp.]|uniref:hypothetical protein n=1 Tax=Treponema sp. TaxID=166 RepID=UPI003F07B378
MKFPVAALLFLYIALLCGCVQKKIDLDFQEQTSIVPDQEWLVVTVPYAPFRVSADYSSEVCFHARSGDVFLICGKKRVKSEAADSKEIKYNLWYKVEQGWIESSLVSIYDTKLKAQSVSRKNYGSKD